MREKENKLKARKPEAEHVLLGLGLIFLSFLVFTFTNIWYANGSAYRNMHLAFGVPMFVIFCSWFIYPSAILVGLLAAVAFLLPPIFHTWAYAFPVLTIEGALAIGFVRLTIRIQKGLQWWDAADR